MWAKDGTWALSESKDNINSEASEVNITKLFEELSKLDKKVWDDKNLLKLTQDSDWKIDVDNDWTEENLDFNNDGVLNINDLDSEKEKEQLKEIVNKVKTVEGLYKWIKEGNQKVDTEKDRREIANKINTESASLKENKTSKNISAQHRTEEDVQNIFNAWRNVSIKNIKEYESTLEQNKTSDSKFLESKNTGEKILGSDVTKSENNHWIKNKLCSDLKENFLWWAKVEPIFKQAMKNWEEIQASSEAIWKSQEKMGEYFSTINEYSDTNSKEIKDITKSKNSYDESIAANNQTLLDTKALVPQIEESLDHVNSSINILNDQIQQGQELVSWITQDILKDSSNTQLKELLEKIVTKNATLKLKKKFAETAKTNYQAELKNLNVKISVIVAKVQSEKEFSSNLKKRMKAHQDAFDEKIKVLQKSIEAEKKIINALLIKQDTLIESIKKSAGEIDEYNSKLQEKEIIVRKQLQRIINDSTQQFEDSEKSLKIQGLYWNLNRQINSALEDDVLSTKNGKFFESEFKNIQDAKESFDKAVWSNPWNKMTIKGKVKYIKALEERFWNDYPELTNIKNQINKIANNKLVVWKSRNLQIEALIENAAVKIVEEIYKKSSQKFIKIKHRYENSIDNSISKESYDKIEHQMNSITFMYNNREIASWLASAVDAFSQKIWISDSWINEIGLTSLVTFKEENDSLSNLLNELSLDFTVDTLRDNMSKKINKLFLAIPRSNPILLSAWEGFIKRIQWFSESKLKKLDNYLKTNHLKDLLGDINEEWMYIQNLDDKTLNDKYNSGCIEIFDHITSEHSTLNETKNRILKELEWERKDTFKNKTTIEETLNIKNIQNNIIWINERLKDTKFKQLVQEKFTKYEEHITWEKTTKGWLLIVQKVSEEFEFIEKLHWKYENHNEIIELLWTQDGNLALEDDNTGNVYHLYAMTYASDFSRIEHSISKYIQENYDLIKTLEPHEMKGAASKIKSTIFKNITKNQGELNDFIKDINNPTILTLLSEVGTLSELKSLYKKIIDKVEDPKNITSINDIYNIYIGDVTISAENKKLLDNHLWGKSYETNHSNDKHKLWVLRILIDSKWDDQYNDMQQIISYAENNNNYNKISHIILNMSKEDTKETIWKYFWWILGKTQMSGFLSGKQSSEYLLTETILWEDKVKGGLNSYNTYWAQTYLYNEIRPEGVAYTIEKAVPLTDVIDWLTGVSWIDYIHSNTHAIISLLKYYQNNKLVEIPKEVKTVLVNYYDSQDQISLAQSQLYRENGIIDLADFIQHNLMDSEMFLRRLEGKSISKIKWSINLTQKDKSNIIKGINEDNINKTENAAYIDVDEMLKSWTWIREIAEKGKKITYTKEILSDKRQKQLLDVLIKLNITNSQQQQKIIEAVNKVFINNTGKIDKTEDILTAIKGLKLDWNIKVGNITIGLVELDLKNQHADAQGKGNKLQVLLKQKTETIEEAESQITDLNTIIISEATTDEDKSIAINKRDILNKKLQKLKKQRQKLEDDENKNKKTQRDIAIASAKVKIDWPNLANDLNNWDSYEEASTKSDKRLQNNREYQKEVKEIEKKYEVEETTEVKSEEPIKYSPDKIFTNWQKVTESGVLSTYYEDESWYMSLVPDEANQDWKYNAKLIWADWKIMEISISKKEKDQIKNIEGAAKEIFNFYKFFEDVGLWDSIVKYKEPLLKAYWSLNISTDWMMNKAELLKFSNFILTIFLWKQDTRTKNNSLSFAMLHLRSLTQYHISDDIEMGLNSEDLFEHTLRQKKIIWSWLWFNIEALKKAQENWWILETNEKQK